jgi:ATP-dependent Clp protease, protease subunit
MAPPDDDKILDSSSNTKSLKDLGIYLFMDEVSQISIKPVVEWIIEENYTKEKKKFLQLFINSPGGDLSACFTLTDFMVKSAVPVHTFGIGEIASCGFLIFIAGEKGYRTITNNTAILSHQYSWGKEGKHHELVASRKEEDLILKRMTNHYEKHITVKKNKPQIIKKLLEPSDVWLSPEEALKFGIADHIKTTI